MHTYLPRAYVACMHAALYAFAFAALIWGAL